MKLKIMNLLNESINDTNNITLKSKIPKYKRKKINKKDYIEEKFY